MVGTEPIFKFRILQPYMSKRLAALVYQEVLFARHYYLQA